MKKLFLLMIGLLIVSCSHDTLDTTSNRLKSIAVTNYSNNHIASSHKMNFEENKLTTIAFHNGVHHEYQYSNHLVSQIAEYDFADRLMWTQTYTYDSNGRIIEIQRTPNSDDPLLIATKSTFAYNPNQILVTAANSLGEVSEYELLLDQNNKIISEQTLSVNGSPVATFSYNFTYINGNHATLTSSLADDPLRKTCTYLDQKNDFNYHQYLFGSEWKMNYCLDYFSKELSVIDVLQVTSENLPSGYTYTYVKNTIHSEDNGLFGYFYNDKHQIIKEVLSKSSTSHPYYRQELNYEYH